MVTVCSLGTTAFEDARSDSEWIVLIQPVMPESGAWTKQASTFMALSDVTVNGNREVQPVNLSLGARPMLWRYWRCGSGTAFEVRLEPFIDVVKLRMHVFNTGLDLAAITPFAQSAVAKASSRDIASLTC